MILHTSVRILLQSIGITAGIVLLFMVLVFFGVPAWFPDRKPSKEVLVILMVLLLLALVIVGLAVWEYRTHTDLYPASLI